MDKKRHSSKSRPQPHGKRYYTADLHFFSEATLKKCKRPFADVNEMNRILVENINKRCTKYDTLYILGDVADGYLVPDVTELLAAIKPRKILIRGNHDGTYRHGELSHKKFCEQFDGIYDSLMMSDGGRDLFLSHYPYCEWDGLYKGRLNLYGHVHNETDGVSAIAMLIPTAINVGVDVNDYMPKTLDELWEKRVAEYQIPDESLFSFMSRTVLKEPKKIGFKVLDLSPFKEKLAEKYPSLHAVPDTTLRHNEAVHYGSETWHPEDLSQPPLPPLIVIKGGVS